MSAVVQTLNKSLAESFAFYLKAQFFHWNVTGKDFPQYHEFFGDIYSEVYGSVDTTAEQIRAADGIAYGSFSQYDALSSIKGATEVPSSVGEMVATLYTDNDVLLASWNAAFSAAEAANEQGLMDYIAGRIDAHRKHRWMLKSSMERVAATPANETRVYVLDPKNM